LESELLRLEGQGQSVHQQPVVTGFKILSCCAFEGIACPQVAEADHIGQVVINLVAGGNIGFAADLVAQEATLLDHFYIGIARHNVEGRYRFDADKSLIEDEIIAAAAGPVAVVVGQGAASQFAGIFVTVGIEKDQARLPVTAGGQAPFDSVGRRGIITRNIGILGSDIGVFDSVPCFDVQIIGIDGLCCRAGIIVIL